MNLLFLTNLIFVILAVGVFTYSSQNNNNNNIKNNFPLKDQSGNYCQQCINVVNEIETNGCAEACKLIPNTLGQEICNLIVEKAKLCQKILEWAKRILRNNYLYN